MKFVARKRIGPKLVTFYRNMYTYIGYLFLLEYDLCVLIGEVVGQYILPM